MFFNATKCEVPLDTRKKISEIGKETAVNYDATIAIETDASKSVIPLSRNHPDSPAVLLLTLKPSVKIACRDRS